MEHCHVLLRLICFIGWTKQVSLFNIDVSSSTRWQFTAPQPNSGYGFTVALQKGDATRTK